MAPGTGKKRFGVSLPAELADAVDRIAGSMAITRSELVERAVKLYVKSYRHYSEPHRCGGVLLVSGRGRSIEGIIEEYRDIVVQYTHIHVRGKCLKVIVVEGPSTRIASLHSRLESLGCTARYIPLLDEP